MKKTVFFLIVIVVALGAAAAWKFNQNKTPQLEIIHAEKGAIESIIRVTGRVINDRTVTMTALVNGQIQGMLVQKGDRVKAGQVLAFLDKREADALVKKAAAVVLRERQSVDEAARKLERLKKISISGSASEQAVEDAEALWRAAQARLQVAEAEHRVAQIHREKVEVTAPWDGVIIEKSAEQGQWLEAGMQLFTLVAEQGREIEANVDAGDSGEVAIGQTVTVTCDAFPGQRWQEKVQWISPAIITDDNATLNSFAVRMSLGNAAPPLLLGQQVDVEISTAQRQSVVKLPYTALVESESDSARVAVVRQGKVQYVSVTTGIEDYTHVEITSGIEEGDAVIIPHNTPPMEGMEVPVLPESSS